MEFLNAHPWLLALLIFLARITDVSLGTVRTIMVFRGYRLISAMIGFCEVLIWIIAVGHVMKNLTHWYLIISYAAGFATGNMVGIWLEAKLAIGNAVVRVISENPEIQMSERLRERDYVVTEVYGKGSGPLPVEISFIAEKRRGIPALLQLIEEIDPDAFYTVEDIRTLHNGHIGMGRGKSSQTLRPRHFAGYWRKESNAI